LKRFLIIGPSGIGKSTVIKNLNLDNWETVCLDSELSKAHPRSSVSALFREIGEENFSYKSIEFIEKYTTSKNCIFDVGAGSIAFPGNHSWYIEQNVIVLLGDAEIIYPRSDRQKEHPTIVSYKNMEFNQNRMALYNKCKFKVDVTELNEGQVREELVKILTSQNPI
jgi:shikimate kinase